MNHNDVAQLGPLGDEAEGVLVALAACGPDASLKLNDLSHRTGLPTGHVGRHLRTLERDRLVRYLSGAWQATGRGIRRAADDSDGVVSLSH
jgi:DNA-binding IclR family transcriptional regulator